MTDPSATPIQAIDEGALELIDLTAIERDLAAVEAALPRLDDGSYWVDEVTGDPLSDELLAVNPVARRV